MKVAVMKLAVKTQGVFQICTNYPIHSFHVINRKTRAIHLYTTQYYNLHFFIDMFYKQKALKP